MFAVFVPCGSTGSYPLNFEKMAAVTAGFRELDAAEADRVVQHCLPPLCSVAFNQGEVEEVDFGGYRG